MILTHTAAIRGTAILAATKQFLPTIASPPAPATMMTANVFHEGIKLPPLPQPLLLGGRSRPHQGGRTLQVEHGRGEERCQGGMRQRQVWWQFLEATTTRLLLRLPGTASSLIL